MRARVTEVKEFTPTKELHTLDGRTIRVSRGTEISLTVVEIPESNELSRIGDMRDEIILAPIPVRKTDGVTEGNLAKWADILARDPWRDDGEHPEFHRAVLLLLPEVVALRRENEALQREVKARREHDARPLTEKLAEIATYMQMVVEAKDGTIVLSPKPPDPYEYDY